MIFAVVQWVLSWQFGGNADDTVSPQKAAAALTRLVTCVLYSCCVDCQDTHLRGASSEASQGNCQKSEPTRLSQQLLRLFSQFRNKRILILGIVAFLRRL